MAAVKKVDAEETASNRESENSSAENASNMDDVNPRAWIKRFQAWRESIRDRPTANRIYRVMVGVVGGAIVIGGLGLIPLPGPGWVIVFLGLAILGTEFVWAQRLNDFARRQLKAWTTWLGRQPLWVRGLVGLATAVFVLCIIWALFAISGVPSWIPWVPPLPGL